MRKHKLRQANQTNKKGVQFSLPAPETTQREREEGREIGESGESSGGESTDTDAGSLYGMNGDSSDEGELVVSMSPFGMMWSSLDCWITPSSIRFLQRSDDDDSSLDIHRDRDKKEEEEEEVREEQEEEEEEYKALADPSQNALRRRTLTSSIFQQ